MTITLYKNSFVTLEEAEAYFDERFDSEKWFSLTDEQKEKLLITSSKKINMFDFVGEKINEEQEMAFPRNFDLPQDIKDAVCEEALSLVEKADSVHCENKKNGIRSVSLGSGSITYGDDFHIGEEGQLNSSQAAYLVKKWVKKGYKFLG